MSKIEITEHCRLYKNYLFFLNGPLCQWWKSKFVENNIEYCCCEQYMMYQKALLFNDKETANKILNTKEPREQKKLGREVKNFDEHVWDVAKEKIVYNGNYLKFSQNEDLKEYLCDTHPYELVEANKYDRIWGIGMFSHDPNILDTSKWGQNLLGKILMNVRNNFVSKDNINEYKKEEMENNNYKEKYTYLLAEFENYKKRMVKDKEFLKNDAIISTIEPFLQINDFLGMAKIACEKSDNIESIKYGLNMIFDKFYETLSNMNIKKIESIGNKFDPNLHNAIEYKHSDDVQEGYIIAEIKAGYLYGDKVIHPSDVIVSSGNE
jgi:ribA/ribD-fused uncharacterized protein